MCGSLGQILPILVLWSAWSALVGPDRPWSANRWPQVGRYTNKMPISWHILCSFVHFGRFCPLCSRFASVGCFVGQLLATFAHICPYLTAFAHWCCWLLLATLAASASSYFLPTSTHFWPFLPSLAGFDCFWPHFFTFGHFW